MVFKRIARGARRGLRRIGRGARKVGKAVGKGASAVNKVTSKINSVLESPLGQVAMTGLKLNPKTSKAAHMLEAGLQKGEQYSDIVNRLSEGDKKAVLDVIQEVEANAGAN